MDQATARALLARINAEEGQLLGPRIDAGAAADPRTKLFGVDSTTGIGFLNADYTSEIKEGTLSTLRSTNQTEFSGKGLLLLNGVAITDAQAQALPYAVFRTLTIGFDRDYKLSIEAAASNAPAAAPSPPIAAQRGPPLPIAAAPAIDGVINPPTPSAQTLQIPSAGGAIDQRVTDPRVAASVQHVEATAAPRPIATATAPATPTSSPLTLGRITPQTTVLDLIVSGIQSSTDGDALKLKAAATAKLSQELTQSKPELASNPQALAAAVQQGLHGSIRGLMLELSKDKATQQRVASGFLDAMRRENPSAEQSSFYQNLKRLSSNEQTFGAFLNTNMMEGITKDYEQRARAENGGRVPATVMDAVANNIMRVKPEIKQYNDRLGQSINDFVCNPEISRQRLLQSASTQREIRDGVAKFRREHPFQTFFADMIGTNMHAEGEKRALAEMTKRGLRDRNYSREIQSGFISEFNRRAENEMRGEQLENVHAFTRHLSHLPYSRFIQEDISPRRMSAIILGIERLGEERTPTRHIIPQQLITRNQSPHVNVVAAQPLPDPSAPRQQQPPRPALHSAV